MQPSGEIDTCTVQSSKSGGSSLIESGVVRTETGLSCSKSCMLLLWTQTHVGSSLGVSHLNLFPRRVLCPVTQAIKSGWSNHQSGSPSIFTHMAYLKLSPLLFILLSGL